MDRSNLEILFDEEYKIDVLMKEFDKDCKLPNEIAKLSTFNLNKGFLLNKWIMKYTRISSRVKELKVDIDKLENTIKQKCRHDVEFNKNWVIDKAEMNEKIAIDEDWQKIKYKLVRYETIQNLISEYVEHFKYMNAQINNQIEIIKLSSMAY